LRLDPDDAPDPLERIAATLAETVAAFEDAEAPPPLLAGLRPLPELVRQAAAGVRERGTPLEMVTPWRHSVRSAAGAVTGWAQLYLAAAEESARQRAHGKLEQSVAPLRTLLAAPP
jgi:hypothetical protein